MPSAARNGQSTCELLDESRLPNFEPVAEEGLQKAAPPIPK
jgi:hypothetical protein